MTRRQQVDYLVHSLGLRSPHLNLLESMDGTRRWLFGAPSRRYAEVALGLFVGGQHTRAGLAELRAWGVTSIVNLRVESDDQRLQRALDRYLYLPVIDGQPPALEQLERGADFIAGEIAAGGAVYVHCWQGVGRAPTLAAAYLVSAGQPLEAAWAAVKAGRPFIRPTPAQVRRVADFAARLESG